MSRAFRLGITGKIGSGKSTFSDIARKSGIKVLDADSIAKEVMSNDPEVRREVAALLGPESYIADTINSTYIASKIFTEDSLRQNLEAIVHPATLEVIEREFRSAQAGEIIALESAILFQTGLDEIFDAVVLIDSNDSDIIRREEASGKFDTEDIQTRLSKQNFQNEWKEDADFVLRNTGTKEELITSSEALLQVIKIIASQDLPDVGLRILEV